MEVVAGADEFNRGKPPLRQGSGHLLQVAFEIRVASLGIIRQEGIRGYATGSQDDAANLLHGQEGSGFLGYEGGTTGFEQVATDFVFYPGFVVEGRLQGFATEQLFVASFDGGLIRSQGFINLDT